MEFRFVRLRQSILMLAVTLVHHDLVGANPQTSGGPGVRQGSARQVTVMVIRAEKGVATKDPKLEKVESRLAQLLPDFGFSLEQGKTRGLAKGESLTLSLKDGRLVNVSQIDPEDGEGKVRMKVRCESGDHVLIDTSIRTPPNQLFFLDHRINDTQHLLIAVGAR